ncbi:MAG: methylthioribulose 1-phosphate dehydratase [Acidobacteriota bacterium]
MAGEALSGIAGRLAEIGRRFYMRGWVMGTSGNFSAVVSRQPFRLAITASSVHKGQLSAADILQCDEHGAAVDGRGGTPSAETLLHLEIVRRRGAEAVLHTHSVWATVLSDLHAGADGFTIEGYEMLKGLHGVRSHDHREWVPILANDQDMPRLAQRVGETLDRFSTAHAFLLRRHGLYTWGETLADAERHVEILEFLFETVGRSGIVKLGIMK